MNRDLEKKRESLGVRLRGGDREAAAEFVDAYYGQIYLYMRRLGHSREVSEDLTQESFLRAWDHIGQLRDGRALNSWLYHIAGNASKMYWRRHKSADAVSFDKIEVPDGSEGDSGKVEHYEQLNQLRSAIAGLPIKLREVIILHYMQQLSIVESAEAAGVRVGTFKSRLNRVLKVLRKQFI